MTLNSPFERQLIEKIKILHEGPWEHRAPLQEVHSWLDNFNGQAAAEDDERRHALHLLSVFTYFGDRELRVLLRSMYRDLFKYPLVEQIRRRNGDTLDESLIAAEFRAEEIATRFIGIGNPSESGTHLLYYFRQENGLHRGHFMNTHEIFTGRVMTGQPIFEDPTIRHYVFIDDFCGSGSQAQQYSAKVVDTIKSAASSAGTSVTASYYVLAATESGLATVRNSTSFDSVDCVYELDESHKAFDSTSRYYPGGVTEVDRSTGESIARSYGAGLLPDHPVGYLDGQLLIGFHHNVPDNSLPIFWYSEPSSQWTPIFRRYPKVG